MGLPREGNTAMADLNTTVTIPMNTIGPDDILLLRVPFFTSQQAREAYLDELEEVLPEGLQFAVIPAEQVLVYRPDEEGEEDA